MIIVLSLSCERQATKKPSGEAKPSAFSFSGRPTAAITFLSTQLNPVEEADKMRNSILKDFPGKVEFRPNDNNYLFSQIDSMLNSDPSESILIGALHGDLVRLYEEKALQPLDGIYESLANRSFPESLAKLSRLDGKDMYYIPWMQASFVMVANKKALPYLPKGARLDELSYAQLEQWAKNIFEATKMRALGFPAGEKGLMHRFFQGYLYPSFTASALLKFRSPDAKDMWAYFKELWLYAHPGSLVYSTMAEPLLAGDVWIAWDHTARLVKVFEQKPQDFVAFPAPIGPKGRGMMAVISGLSIPANAQDNKNQAFLIDYLTQPAIQARTLRETGFFPVVELKDGESKAPYLDELSSALDRQVNSPDAIATLPPIGLGERGDDYNHLFMLTFSEIVLDGKDIQTVLDENGKEMQKLLDEQNVKCWPPDVSEERPCKIE